MQIIENLKIKEKLYTKKMKNGLNVLFIPKKGAGKKYVIWGTHYGSIDNKFIVPGETNITEVPEGVAHYLEHKMFEQKNGKNSLDVLTKLGVNANAYTTNNHTAYLFECTDNFYEALDELMDYVQNPYFTDENVEKEKGIIGQEIMMYDDYPEWKSYINCLKGMYHKNPVKLDIAGTIESISKIDKEVLYKCYNTFYNPANMCMVICGDFEPEEIFSEVEKRLTANNASDEIKRIYEFEEETIVKSKIEDKMEISIPLFAFGIKCKPSNETRENIRKYLAIQILLYLIIGESSDLYKKLYEQGILLSAPSFDFEFTEQYSHIIISGNTREPEKLYDNLIDKIRNLKINGLNNEDFNRTKKMIYGMFVKNYNDVREIAKMFLFDYMRNVNSFDYLEELDGIDLKFVKQILDSTFDEEKFVYSVVKPK